MPTQRLNVNLSAAKHIGGIYPFAVVCFDGNLQNELYKSNATTTKPDGLAVWDETFTVDLTREAENASAPRYLTFMLFDTGSPGIPSLGSAGVRLSNVLERGRSAGDFPVVNGTGSVAIVAELEKEDKDGFLHSDAAKITGAVAGTGVALGLGAMALNKIKQRKKKREEDQQEHHPDQYAEENRQGEQPGQIDDDDTSSDEDDANAVHPGQAGDTYAQQTHVAPGVYHAPGVAYASGHVHGGEGEDDADDDDEE